MVGTAQGTRVVSEQDERLIASLGIESLWLRREAAARRLLIVLAHPDDESFGIGSTIARYAGEGVSVHYACATRGECGEVPPELLAGYESVGALRTAELTCAAYALGIAAVHLLNYRDSGMTSSADNNHPDAFMRAPVAQVARQLVGLIRTIRPQVVITFNSYGGYGHPDHIQAHRATLAAVGAAGDPAQYPELCGESAASWETQKLYFNVFGTGLLRVMLAFLRLRRQDPRRFGQNNDIDLLEAFERAGRVTTILDNRAFGAHKERAAACHRSQLNGAAPLQRLPQRLRYTLTARETFGRVIPPFLSGATPETDLFAGVHLD
jgi:mycothiol S-conjugate amidase